MNTGMNLKSLYQNEYSFEEKVNENFFKLESFSTLSIKEKIVLSSENGIIDDILYLIDKNNDELFKDKVNQVACYNANLGWFFYKPKEGNIAYLQDETKFIYFNGQQWVDFNANVGNTIINEDGNVDTSIFLQKSKNLNDLSNISTARNNLSVYSKDEVYNKSEVYNKNEVDDKFANYSSNILENIDQDNFCHSIGTLRDWEIRRVGDYKMSAQKQDHDNWFICDGREVNRSEYPELFALIGTDCGAGNGTTTFNLPDFRNKTMWGANGNLNSTLTSGLPNITGEINGNLVYSSTISCSDSIILNNKSNVPLKGTSSTGIQDATISIDASKSSDIYGKSTIVQPPALCVNVFICVK